MRVVTSLALLVLIGLASPGLAQEVEEIPELAAPEKFDEPFRVHYGHGIQISGTQAFVEHVVVVLDELAELPTGAAILAEFDADDVTVIEEYDRWNASVRALERENFSDGLQTFWGPGEGTAALLNWNPDYTTPGFRRPITMGHELLHALYLNRGEWLMRRRVFGPNRGTFLDELIVIGTGGYEDQPLSENRLRAEWNELYPDDPIPPARYGHGRDFTPFPGNRDARIQAVQDQALPLLGHAHGRYCGHYFGPPSEEGGPEEEGSPELGASSGILGALEQGLSGAGDDQ